eukprot:TRINITY_DN2152_c0_g1_i3.p1 TRINITY_DN2152_c0_g1~~TRINITY_DN2152_c0_g1_i3.p1  ORF type:complete len:144 (-),score=19.50 TRINITY_DN2152_c0_g1_i3:564-995(-)
MNTNNPPGEKKEVLVCTAEGETFVKDYYNTYDTNRQNLLNAYMDEAYFVWNGTRYEGRQGLSGVIGQVPPTTHKLTSLDCQPVPDPTTGNLTGNLLANVLGTVSYSSEVPRTFHQTFLLCTATGGTGLCILSDCFRLVDEILL